MSLQKFCVFYPKDGHSVDNIIEHILINTDHIVTIKPVQLLIDAKVVNGFHIQTSNGKNCTALEIPEKLLSLLPCN